MNYMTRAYSDDPYKETWATQMAETDMETDPILTQFFSLSREDRDKLKKIYEQSGFSRYQLLITINAMYFKARKYFWEDVSFEDQ